MAFESNVRDEISSRIFHHKNRRHYSELPFTMSRWGRCRRWNPPDEWGKRPTDLLSAIVARYALIVFGGSINVDEWNHLCYAIGCAHHFASMSKKAATIGCGYGKRIIRMSFLKDALSGFTCDEHIPQIEARRERALRKGYFSYQFHGRIFFNESRKRLDQYMRLRRTANSCDNCGFVDMDAARGTAKPVVKWRGGAMTYLYHPSTPYRRPYRGICGGLMLCKDCERKLRPIAIQARDSQLLLKDVERLKKEVKRGKTQHNGQDSRCSG